MGYSKDSNLTSRGAFSSSQALSPTKSELSGIHSLKALFSSLKGIHDKKIVPMYPSCNHQWPYREDWGFEKLMIHSYFTGMSREFKGSRVRFGQLNIPSKANH